MKRLRIGINGRVLSNPAVRGWTRYTSNLLRALSERDDVDLVLFCREAPEACHLDGIDAEMLCFDTARESVWEEWRLPAAIRRARIDVFHAPADRGLPLRKPCPFVVTLHNSFERTHWSQLFPAARARAWYWKNEFANAWRSDAIVTVSQTTCAELLALKVCAPEHLHVVALAPAAEFAPRVLPGDAAVVAGLGIRMPFVLFVGGYDPHKNGAALVEAFDASALGQHCLVIAAEPRGDYQRLVDGWRRLACWPRLRFVAPKPDELPALYRSADCLVNPSQWESFSFPLVEAMASGTPVVAAAVSAMPEIVGDAGLLVEPTVTGLRQAMERIAADPALRATLRARGLERVRQLSWARVAAETVAVYRAVAEAA